MEQLTEVKVYRVEFTCDTCGQGKLIYDGLTLSSNPPWFVHKCDHCNVKVNLRQRYPSISHQRICSVQPIG